jgi:DNA-binding Lrp family transcriptional regulator
MDALLKLLKDNAALRPDELAVMLNTTETDVVEKIRALREDKTIVAYQAVLNEEKLGIERVCAVIEVKITPEREGGFDRIATRIAKFSEVRSCYLMSGGYDLLVVVEGHNLRRVAAFVSERLATIPGVVSTATHFMLKTYKQQGVFMGTDSVEEHLSVSP